MDELQTKRKRCLRMTHLEIAKAGKPKAPTEGQMSRSMGSGNDLARLDPRVPLPNPMPPLSLA